MHRSLAMLFSGLLLTSLAAQAPKPSVARAEARASANGNQSQSVTHRVVVVNGKTIVDEKIVDNRPKPGAGPAPLPVPMPGIDDPERMLRELEDQVRRQLPAGVGLGKRDSASSSQQRRVVVVDGNKVVDEGVKQASRPDSARPDAGRRAPEPRAADAANHGGNRRSANGSAPAAKPADARPPKGR